MKILLAILTFFYLSASIAQTPFNCDGELYLTFYNVGATTILNEVDILSPSNATFNPVGSELPFRVNSVGYRITDNFIYGLHPSNRDLYRVDATGSVVVLEDNINLTNGNNYVAGDVTPDGNFLVVVGKSMNNPSNELVLIDLTDPGYSTTKVPLIDFTTGLPNSTVNVADIAFDPVSGICYGYNSVDKRLVTIDLVSGAINSTRYPSTTAAGIGALFFDSFGTLWGYGRFLPDSDLEDLIKFDLESGSTTFALTGPASNGIDGCSCPFTIGLNKIIRTNTVTQCQEFEIVYPISNLSATMLTDITLEDVLPDGFIIQEIIENPFGGMISGVGTNQLMISDLTLPAGIDSIIINVSASAGISGFFASAAVLNNVPVFFGESIVSDNPLTLQLDDPTGITVLPVTLFDEEIISACGDDSAITLSVNDLSAVEGFTLEWSSGENTPSISVTESGTYAITATNAGCTISDTINVDLAARANLGNDIAFCPPNLVTITNASESGNPSYLWSDGSTESTLTTLVPGTYSLTVTDGNCTSMDEILLFEENCSCEMFFPNAFSPDSDGLNDYFFPITEDDCIFASFQLSIFNRWGAVVYRTNTLPMGNNGWDGRMNGELLNSDVYIWVARYRKNIGDTEKVMGGDVTIIR